MPGAKRGRLLIRQSRVKKDTDPSNQPSPEEMDFETFSGSTYPHHLLPSMSPHVKIERHVSEPAPGRSLSTSSSMHLLSVPQQPPLIKQHSHPLLPSQSTISSDIQFAHQSHSHHPHHHPHLTLHRQLSYPTSTETASLLLHSSSTSSLSPSPIILTTPPPLSASSTSSTSQLISASLKTESLELGGSITSAVAGDVSSLSTISNVNATDLRSSESIAASNLRSKSHDLSPTIVVVSEPLSMSVDHVPSLRVKSEELQRSLSTPQVSSLSFYIN